VVSGSYNYFKSGNYYFENTGNWTIDSAFVLFGYPGASEPSIPGDKNNDTFAGNPCNTAWQAMPRRVRPCTWAGTAASRSRKTVRA
jgi:hypothetical protein